MAELDQRDVYETLAAFRRLPKEASQALRKESFGLSESLARKAKSAGLAMSAQDALVANTVRPARDRLPAIAMGGSKRVGRNKKPVYKVMYGSEFGSNTLKQFRSHRGREGYWFYPTVRNDQAAYIKMWSEVADTIGRAWVDNSSGLSISTIRSVVDV